MHQNASAYDGFLIGYGSSNIFTKNENTLNLHLCAILSSTISRTFQIHDFKISADIVLQSFPFFFFLTIWGTLLKSMVSVSRNMARARRFLGSGEKVFTKSQIQYSEYSKVLS